MSGGKGTTQTSQIQIPPQVLARYDRVNALADKIDTQPFQEYTGQFVAPVTATQQGAIARTTNAAGQAQPAFQQALGLAGGSNYNVDPQDLNVQKYLSPYLSTVLGSTSALLNQNNQQQQAGQLGTAIQSGAFGGDRAGIAAANLAQQQQMANANIYSNILNQGYGQALSTAQQQQGVQLGAEQANRANTQNVAQLVAGLGSAGQTAALQGAQAQLGAGSVEQQTQQALNSALYNQFLQKQSLPYQQLAQLADIAMGVGSLSGSTTTTNTVQNGIFSDKRLKEDAREVGRTFDGQPIYSYRYKGDSRTQIGLMADEVERRHPDAVGLASGYKTVDYEKATDKAAERGHFAMGGVPFIGDGSPYIGDGSAADVMASRFQAMYGPLLSARAQPIPQHTGANYQLHPAQVSAPQMPSAAQTVNDYANLATNVNKAGTGLGLWGGEGDDAGALNDITPQSAEADALASLKGVRTGLATGGTSDLPYQPANGIDIPDTNKSYELHPAQPTASGGGGGDVMGTVKDIASIAAMFAASGGRVGRADGGVLYDDGEEQPDADSKFIKQLMERLRAAQPKDEDSSAAASNDNPPEEKTGLAAAKKAAPDFSNVAKGGHLDSDAVSYLTEHGIPKHVALGVAAGIHAESGNRPGVRNPKSGAFGLGQWLGPRAEKLREKYGDNPTKGEQLEYLLYELKGGDHGGLSVLSSRTPEEALQNYITKFMRPAKGYETDRDISSGLGALRAGFADGGVPDAPPEITEDDDAKRRAIAAQDAALGKPSGLGFAQPESDARPAPVAPPAAPAQAVSAPRQGEISPLLYPYLYDRYMQNMPENYGSGRNVTDTSFGSQVKHGKADAILSILAGLGAAGTANTSNPLYALATGLSAGAQAYQGQRQFENERAKSAQDYAIKRARAGFEGALAAGALYLTPAQRAEFMQRALGFGIGNTQTAAQTQIILQDMLRSGQLPKEALGNIPSYTAITGDGAAPPTANTISAPEGAPGVAPAAGAPAAPAGSVAATMPNLQGITPKPPAPVAAPKPEPMVNPGDGIVATFRKTNPEWQQYSSMQAQADAMTQSMSPALAGTDYGRGIAAKADALRAQAAVHKANAEAQFASQVQPNVGVIQKKATDLADFAQGKYQNIANATKSALDAAASATLSTESPEWGRVWGRLQSAGLPIPDWGALTQGAAEISQRNRALINAFNIGPTGISARAEGTELAALNKYGTNSPGPASGYDAAIKTRALAEQQYAYAQDFAKAAPSMVDEPKWTLNWVKSHPLEGYVHSAVNSNRFAKGMTPEQMVSYIPASNNLAEVESRAARGDKYVNVGGKPYLVKKEKGGKLGGKYNIYPINDGGV